jgi:hypothetical protein
MSATKLMGFPFAPVAHVFKVSLSVTNVFDDEDSQTEVGES